MKTFRNLSLLLLLNAFIFMNAKAQQPTIDMMRGNDKTGLNIFESPKTELSGFTELKVRLGGDFALQLQSIDHESDYSVEPLIKLATNFNLPSANLNIDAQMAKGVRMHLRTYLSARHHQDAWVKGGYLQIDDLDFVSEGFLSDFMKNARFRAGMDMYNYGDVHFRRSDNAAAIYNPFVGNYIMDSFTTEPFLEFTYFMNDLFGVVGWSNGRLNQTPTPGDDGFVLFGKVGYDKQQNEDLRTRFSLSFYNSTDKGTRDYLYGGDRAGARYYKILQTANSASDFDSRFNPEFSSQMAIMANPFVKWNAFELFGVVEFVSNNAKNSEGSFTQLAAELIYRFGEKENFFAGTRYNSVNGKDATDLKKEISRINIGGGWFMTDNIITKLEFVTQSYSGSGFLYNA